MVEALKRQQKEASSSSTLNHLIGAVQYLNRAATVSQGGDYARARQLLRGGPLANFRTDCVDADRLLGYADSAYGVDSAKAGRAAMAALGEFDEALRRAEREGDASKVGAAGQGAVVAAERVRDMLETREQRLGK